MNLELIRKSMQVKKINVSDLAKKADVGQATISELLNGVRKDLRLTTAKKIADVLDIKLEELLRGDVNVSN